MEESARLTALRDRLLGAILRIPDTRLTGHPEQRLPNNVSVAFAGVEGESLLLNLDLIGVAASSGSACTTGSVEPSHVLMAMGVSESAARGHLRLTLGHSTTDADIDFVVEHLPTIVERLRALSTRPV